MKSVSETSEATLSSPKILIIEVPGEADQKKAYEKIFKNIIIKNFLKMRKEITTNLRRPESLIHDKPKEKHVKTYINRTNKT